MANLGYRFADPVFANRTSFPCFDNVGGICYTQRIPALGKQLDCWLTSKQSACLTATSLQTAPEDSSARSQGNGNQGNGNQGNGNQGGDRPTEPPGRPENPGNCRPENLSVDGICFQHGNARRRHDHSVEHGDVKPNRSAEQRRQQSVEQGDTIPPGFQPNR